MSILKIIEQSILPTRGSTSYRNGELVFVAFVIAVGTFLRFWGLGNIGLHGDEETMAMPALAVLEHGGTQLPSGMIYARALAQIYLMAGSVWIFGESEWALRLPSAIVGSLTPFLAFFLGRRFLSSRFNLIFVCVIALLPVMIEYAQTARMYGFWLAALILFGVSIFRWERINTLSSLALAFVAWLVALHFHTVSILAAPLFLFPGLVRKSWGNLVQGAVAIGACTFAFKKYGDWIGSHYPDSSERPVRDVAGTLSADLSPLQLYWEQYSWLLLIGVTIAVAIIIWIGAAAVRRGRFTAAVTLLLLGGGYAGCAALHYHLGVLALLFGSVIWLRNSIGQVRWLYVIWGMVGLTALLQALILYQTGEYPGRQLIGAMVGQPSIWPVLRFAEFSLVAFGIYCVVLAYGMYRLATQRRIPDHMLFFAMSVWAPLLVIGFVTWYLPPRYTAGVLPYFLLSCVAGMEFLFRKWEWLPRILAGRPIAGIAVSMLLVVAIANPFQLRKVINTDYSWRPDHKGAADFLKSLPITDDDVIIAEDALQQTYYLGEVDYWLRNFDDAASFAISINGESLDQYTGSPIIGSGAELLEILDKNLGRRVFIIGSGEIPPERDEWARGRGIGDVLRMDRLKVVYEGRDGITKVWMDAKQIPNLRQPSQ